MGKEGKKKGQKQMFGHSSIALVPSHFTHYLTACNDWVSIICNSWYSAACHAMRGTAYTQSVFVVVNGWFVLKGEGELLSTGLRSETGGRFSGSSAVNGPCWASPAAKFLRCRGRIIYPALASSEHGQVGSQRQAKTHPRSAGIREVPFKNIH